MGKAESRVHGSATFGEVEEVARVGIEVESLWNG